MSQSEFHTAIIGGGLCGLALAIALQNRKIPYTIYEARSSFTEIGAGLNLGPNALSAFKAIDSSLADRIFEIAVRNAPGEEDVWMNFRAGAPMDHFVDGELLGCLRAPPTGNLTVSRNELLQLMANAIPVENARFEMKIAGFTQSEEGVVMKFADGREERASVVVACDGAHSTVRRLMLGDHPAASPQFSHAGGYRAVFPMHIHEKAVGADKAHSPQAFCGPGGYVINYPINGGEAVNIGLWQRVKGDWEAEAWVLNNQKQQMQKDFEAWGAMIKGIMDLMSDETQFWATFHHSEFPEHYFDGRVCLIGDAAHAMGPHQGQGASQAMEDAAVIADLLSHVSSSRASHISTSTSPSLNQQISAALQAFENIRRPRFEKVLLTSNDALDMWSDLSRKEHTREDMAELERKAYERFTWIWEMDVAGQGVKAVEEMERLLRDGVVSDMKAVMNGDVKN